MSVEAAPPPRGRPLRTAFFIALAVIAAIAIGVVAGALFARTQVAASRARLPAVPGEFEPAAPRPLDVAAVPVPVPTSTVTLAIGFLDDRTNVAVPRAKVTAKVGDCVVARLQPGRKSPYRRLLGGEKWSVGGHPQMEVRPGDAPGYCLVWLKPSGAKGYPIGASAVVGSDAGARALGEGDARVVVRGSPKPQNGSTSRIIRHGRAKPRPQATPDDQ